MNLTYFDSSQPIVPDKSLGGVLLRANIGDYEEDLITMMMGCSEHAAQELLRVLDAWYIFRPCHIKIGVCVTNGKIFQLTALERYRGELFGQIRVGMRAEEALSLRPDLYYDQSEDGLFSKIHEGLALSLSEPDPPAEKVPSLEIRSISIFAPELHFWGGPVFE